MSQQMFAVSDAGVSDAPANRDENSSLAPFAAAVSGGDITAARADFPIFARTRPHGHPLVYLDSAASAQKPRAVLDALARTYESAYANVHRGMHHLSNTATANYEHAREQTRSFLNAAHSDEIIFTGGSTDALNLVASSFAEPLLQAGDAILLSIFEHHSNIVPWHFLRTRKGVKLRWVLGDNGGNFDLAAFRKAFAAASRERIKLLAITHMSNATGAIAPLKEIIASAHEHGIAVVVDGSQAAVHMEVDVQDLDCDFYAVTGHKLYAPSGIGVLYGKREHLRAMRPYRGGGEMIREVFQDSVSYAEPPHRFEAGTPPIAQAIGLGAALDYIRAWGWQRISAHESELRAHALECLGNMEGLRTLGVTEAGGAILSFVTENAHAHDIATVLDQYGVAVRAGHHCAQPLLAHLGVTATARASFALYNSHEDVESLGRALQRGMKLFA